MVQERARVAKMANRAIASGGTIRVDNEGRPMQRVLLIDSETKPTGFIGFKRRWVWQVKS